MINGRILKEKQIPPPAPFFGFVNYFNAKKTTQKAKGEQNERTFFVKYP